jgi:hypothetical protein
MSVDHAKHNEDLCLKLFAENNWNDWVVTTAFYSAIHYVDNRIFPLKIKEKEYHNIDEYVLTCTDGIKSKHDARTKLVKHHAHKAFPAYKLLRDTCRTARYNDYKLSDAMAEAATKQLALIKSLCTSSSVKIKEA